MYVEMWAFTMKFLVFLVILCSIFLSAGGHGRLADPPGRASAWRYGFDTPPDYNDNQLFCGGFSHQRSLGMKCGICGDAWDGSRPHEAGGKYATGTIVRNYTEGAIIDINVQLTASHEGYFEFRICPNNDVTKRATQECLDEHLLVLENGNTKYQITSFGAQWVRTKARLPAGLTCTQCVLQWKYNTGNSLGTDKKTGKSCTGCGDQEQFYGCADVSIQNSNGSVTVPPPPEPTEECRGTGRFTGRADMDAWCQRNCALGDDFCPKSHCKCEEQWQQISRRPIERSTNGIPVIRSYSSCKGTGPWTGDSGMDSWCRTNCAVGYCPSSHCICG